MISDFIVIRERIYEWSSVPLDHVDLVMFDSGRWEFEIDLQRKDWETDGRKKVVLSIGSDFRDSTGEAVVEYRRHAQRMGENIDVETVDDRPSIPDLWPRLGRRLLGFVLDLGAVRPSPLSPDLVGVLSSTKRVLVAPMPVFIPDDRWDGRHEEAKTYEVDLRGRSKDSLPHRPPFLGVLTGFAVDGPGRNPSRPVWLASALDWNNSMIPRGIAGDTPEKAVDHLLFEFARVRPERDREEWERKNVERGTFLAPTEDEVAVYRAMGECLPFFWNPRDLHAWLVSWHEQNGVAWGSP